MYLDDCAILVNFQSSEKVVFDNFPSVLIAFMEAQIEVLIPPFQKCFYSDSVIDVCVCVCVCVCVKKGEEITGWV